MQKGGEKMKSPKPIHDSVDGLTAAFVGVATERKQAMLANLETLEAMERDDRKLGEYHPGDVIVLTARHLWFTRAGLDGPIAADIVREWTVQECRCDLCLSGRFVCTTARAYTGGWRHFARDSVRHRGRWLDELPASVQPKLNPRPRR
jgi:hypothetical protein